MIPFVAILCVILIVWKVKRKKKVNDLAAIVPEMATFTVEPPVIGIHKKTFEIEYNSE